MIVVRVHHASYQTEMRTHEVPLESRQASVKRK